MLMNLNTIKQFLEFATSIFFCFKHHGKIFVYSALNLHASKNIGIKVNVYMTTCISVIWAFQLYKRHSNFGYSCPDKLILCFTLPAHKSLGEIVV